MEISYQIRRHLAFSLTDKETDILSGDEVWG